MYDPRYQSSGGARAASILRKVRPRTWLIIGGVVVGILGLFVWAGIAVLSWLWGQVPTAATAGNRLVGDAMTQIEQSAPGLKEQIGQWVPGLKDQVSQWAPSLAEDLPASDVSGTDLGPVPRFAGLVRTSFSRREGAVEVRYAGPATFEAVRAHYVQGFTTAGYAQEVIDASPDAENHRFTTGQETIELALLREAGGRVEVRLKSNAQ